MSDEKNVFDFHGLSDDEELDKLLESVRRDIGEASPEPERSARTQPRREAPAAREPVQAAAPSAAAGAAESTGAPHAGHVLRPSDNSLPHDEHFMGSSFSR